MPKKSGVPGSVRRHVMLRDRLLCAACGIQGIEARRNGYFSYPTPEPGVHLSIDHILPRSRGGSSDPSNLRVLCTRCNSVKGTRVLSAGSRRG